MCNTMSMVKHISWLLIALMALTVPRATAGPPGYAGVGQSVSSARPGARLAAARLVAARASMRNLAAAVRALHADTGRLPSNGEGLLILVERPLGWRGWRGPYIASSSWQPGMLDPWGNGYRYVNTTLPGGRPSFSILSSGPDGVALTADDLQIDG